MSPDPGLFTLPLLIVNSWSFNMSLTFTIATQCIVRAYLQLLGRSERSGRSVWL